ncbi:MULTISPECIES: hypothetical protein [Caldicellulosiruptor]|uniref:hypothetical protein n=1 Tax=Caldicellulosiruptor TaxID=44000 RepID=UPI0003A4D330|nr:MULTISPECIES: hypothetical protein [Caldicellulosiruptor]
MKKLKDFESERETFQNFLHVNKGSLQDELTTTIEKQNQSIFKKLEEKKRL